MSDDRQAAPPKIDGPLEFGNTAQIAELKRFQKEVEHIMTTCDECRGEGYIVCDECLGSGERMEVKKQN